MTDYVNSSLADMYTDFTAAADGDRVLLTDGVYDTGGSNHNLTKTSATAIVKFMAQHRGRVTLTGYGINLGSDNTIFEGFDIQYNRPESGTSLISVNGDNCQITRCNIHPVNLGVGLTQKWVQWKADNGLFDYNEVHSKTCIDDMFLASNNSTSPMFGIKVLHNYFHNFIQNPTDTRSEPIRIGESSMAMVDFNAEVAYNLIENMDTDTEIVSVKASNVNVHHNTLKDVFGGIVLRQGHNCKVKYNTMLGDAQMVRFYGHGHEIEFNQCFNNSVGGVASTVWIGNADKTEYPTVQDGSIDGVPGQVIGLNSHYAQTKNNKFRHNIINNGSVTSSDGVMLLGGDAGTTDRPYPPIDNEIKNNYIILTDGVATFQKAGTFPCSWAANDVKGNVFNLSGPATLGAGFPSAGYVLGSLPLLRHPDGTYRCVYVIDTNKAGVNSSEVNI